MKNTPRQFTWKKMDGKGRRSMPKGGGETKKRRKQFPKKFGKHSVTKSGSADPRKEMLEMLTARTELSEAQLLEVAPNEKFKPK